MPMAVAGRSENGGTKNRNEQKSAQRLPQAKKKYDPQSVFRLNAKR
jgi:hypothetical protein